MLDTLRLANRANPNASLSTTLQYVAESATKEVAQLNLTPEQKRLAFVGGGWAKRPGEDSLKPIYALVANCRDKTGAWLPQAAPSFSVAVFMLPEDAPVMLVSDGQMLDLDLKKRALRLLRRCVDKGLGPATIARLLVATARKVAATNRAVGRDLLVTSIPKASVHHSGMMVYGTVPMTTKQTFTYVPGDGLRHVQHGPCVFYRGVVAKDIKVCRE